MYIRLWWMVICQYLITESAGVMAHNGSFSYLPWGTAWRILKGEVFSHVPATLYVTLTVSPTVVPSVTQRDFELKGYLKWMLSFMRPCSLYCQRSSSLLFTQAIDVLRCVGRSVRPLFRPLVSWLKKFSLGGQWLVHPSKWSVMLYYRWAEGSIMRFV